MTRTLRALILALSLSATLVVTGVPASALAAARPVVTKVGAGAGPLRPSTVVITGTSLKRVVAVRFGGRAAAVLGASGPSSVTVRTPVGARPGTVAVQVRTLTGGWSAVTGRSRYTFVPAPELTRVAPSSGHFSGGTKVTLTGRHLESTVRVTVGGEPATVVSRLPRKLVIRTPIGVLGPAPVVVTTPGGATSGRRFTFTYTSPPDQARSEITPAAGTHVATDVAWVTGGRDEATGADAPWSVGLPKGAAVPAIGQLFLLRPGHAAFVSGLAGKVTEVADQLDETVRLTVVPTTLDSVVSGLSLDYSGTVTEPAAGRNRAAAGTSSTIEFPLQGSTALICKDRDGQSVSFGSDLTVAVSDIDVDQHVDLGRLGRRASYDSSFTAELRTTGKITVSRASTCKPKDAWVNAHRKVIPLGTTGATLSIGPAFELVISAEGTWSVTDRTRTTFALEASFGSRPRFTRTSRSVEHSQSGEVALQVTATGGVSVQFGLLDRAGVQGKVLLGIAASLTAGTAPEICVQAELFGEFHLGLFLDAWVARWEYDALNARFSFLTWRRCVGRETPATSGEPEILSARLPDAIIGTAYRTALRTADDRAGRWTVVRNPLPAGLTLAEDGTISGTPTGPVGDHPVIVDFTDAAGKVATTTVRIMVQPGQALGGGDIQATLRWSGAADLDLHVIDPSGTEIFYGRPTSPSGGKLDHDANAGCNGPADDDNPVENVFWPTGAAPTGGYTVWVKVYNPCGAPLDWTLSVRRNGVTVVNESGTGDSSAYSFTLGSGAATSATRSAAAAVRTGPAPAGETAPKARGSAGR